MFRIAFAVLLALGPGASSSSAQILAGGSVGSGSFGGSYRPPAPLPFPLHHSMRPSVYPAYPGFSSSYYYGGFGGGFLSSRYYNPYLGWPGVAAYESPQAPPVQMLPPPQRIVELSGESTATLTLEFPAPAKVWLNDELVEGKAEAVRVLTSPAIRFGEKFTFRVRAKWERDGQTFEYTREAALGSGDRSKLLVVSGTAVK